jgi:TetR/AcrR family transcriptional regulator, cholesterol catabolism regulator
MARDFPEDLGTPHAILRCAAGLFRTQGYAATSLRDIAAALDMKAGSLYYHFASKEEIVVEILNLGVRSAYDEVRRSVESLGDGAPGERILRAAVEAHLRALLGPDNFTSANIRIFAHVPQRVQKRTLPLRHDYERYWLELLKSCAEKGTVRADIDLALLSMFLFGAMNWSLEWHKPSRHTIPDLAEAIAALFSLQTSQRARPRTRQT